MPAELVWRPQALEDLMDIYVTIGIDNEEAAERVYSAIEAHTEMLPDFRKWGHAGRRSRRPPACWWKDRTSFFTSSTQTPTKACPR